MANDPEDPTPEERAAQEAFARLTSTDYIDRVLPMDTLIHVATEIWLQLAEHYGGMDAILIAEGVYRLALREMITASDEPLAKASNYTSAIGLLHAIIAELEATRPKPM